MAAAHACLIVDWEGYDGTRPQPKHAGERIP